MVTNVSLMPALVSNGKNSDAKRGSRGQELILFERGTVERFSQQYVVQSTLLTGQLRVTFQTGFEAMLPLKEKDRAVVRMLLSAGCCPRCVLRFCFVGTQTLYRLSCKELRAELHRFLNDGDAESEETDELQPPSKKVRLQGAGESALDPEQNGSAASTLPAEEVHPGDRAGTCTVCLGVLQALCEKDFVKLV
eukprot:gi/632990605/ref/XP_007884243.1/ PREDICTED: putative tRNA pseudouridine synthase Pus10 [Callorhinchus milii]